MGPLFRKSSPLDRQLKEIKAELSAVKSTLRSIAKGTHPLGKGYHPPRHDTASNVGTTPEWKGFETHLASENSLFTPKSSRSRDNRFVTYLATGSFQSGYTLREERRLQRNKALIMVAFVFLVLTVLLYRFLFW